MCGIAYTLVLTGLHTTHGALHNTFACCSSICISQRIKQSAVCPRVINCKHTDQCLMPSSEIILEFFPEINEKWTNRKKSSGGASGPQFLLTHTRTHTHTDTHTHTHTHSHTCTTHACTHARTHARPHRHTHAHTHTHTHTRTHAHAHTHTRACTHTHYRHNLPFVLTQSRQ